MKIFFWNVITLTFLLQGCATTPSDLSAQSSEKKPPEICKNFDYTNDTISDTYPDNYSLWNEFDKFYADAPNGRKLAVFLDGTRNDKEDLTNIRKLYLLAIDSACKGNPVIPYYDKGVDAKWFEKFEFSGVFGTGVSLNIRQAYRFLSQAYKTQPKDEIYLFGFSRGAFTARSLNGFIEFAGLLDGTNTKSSLPLQWISSFESIVDDIYDQYHVESNGTGLKKKISDYEKENYPYPDQKFNDVKVQAIGVFDTVPALGLDRTENPKNHQLKLYANKGFHALSLDEQRKDFQLLHFEMQNEDPDFQKQQVLREVWFSGAHSDIGGGYSSSWGCNTCLKKKSVGFYEGLDATPLNWMITKFKDERLFPNINLFPECVDGHLHDEYFDSDFRLLSDTYPRTPKDQEVIHESVIRRMQVQSLQSPNPQREPISKYIPNNIKSPIPCNYAIEYTKAEDASNPPKEMTCNFYKNK